MVTPRSATRIATKTLCLASRASLASLAVIASLASACAAGAEADATREAEVTAAECSTATSWHEGASFAAGALVTFGGKTYRCLQAHTAWTGAGWTPASTPALWAPVTCAAPGPSADAGTGGDAAKGSDSGSVAIDSGTGGIDSGKTADSGAGAADSGTVAADTGTVGVDAGPTAPSGTDYAPYFYTWGWGASEYAFGNLVDMKAKSGLDGVTLAFVLSNGGCAPTDDIQTHLADVKAFVAAGGHVKASFGGANGTYLENACGDATSLANAISAFVTATGITDLDFDVEQGGAMNASVNALRAQALAKVQATHGVKVAFTLAAFPRDKWGTPGGVTAPSLDVLKSAAAAGVTISHVNLMTMDYGGYYSTGYKMGDLAVSALTDANAQLRSIYPSLSEAQAYAMLGATPMIGVNDVSSEVFGLADATILASFAKTKKLGLLSFWAIQRDQACSSGLGICSGANTSNYQFHAIFKTAK
jgi:chitinase